MPDAFAITKTDHGVRLAVKVVPGSSRTRLAGIYGAAVKVNVAAPPEKGKANKELCRFLAQLFAVGKGDVRVVAGLSSPHKDVEIAGGTIEQVCRVLAEQT